MDTKKGNYFIQNSVQEMIRLPSSDGAMISRGAKGRPWQTGARRLPVLGIIALLGSVICTVVAVYVLLLSDGDSVNSWDPLQPTVYLAISSSISNVLLACALGEGLIVSFWQKAEGSATLQELHQTWHAGTSTWGAVTTLFTGNGKVMAMASLLSLLSIAKGPLFQRASSVSDMTVSQAGTVSLHTAQQLTYGYAGSISGRATSPSYMNSNFSSIVKAYSKRTPINLLQSGCPTNTTCSTSIKAFGFGVECNETDIPYELQIKYNNGSSSNPIVDVFSVGTSYAQTYGHGGSYEIGSDGEVYEGGSNVALIVNSTFKADHEVSLENGGILKSRSCALRGGILSYPVTITNGTLVSFRSQSWQDDEFLEDRGLSDLAGTTITNIGGFYLAANYLFAGTASMYWGGAVGYVLNFDGLTSAQYVETNNSSDSVISNSGTVAWTDPTDDVINAMREIAFRTSLQIAAENITMAGPVQETAFVGEEPQTIYTSDRWFMIAGTIVSLLGIVGVLPTYSGFWRMGRTMSLSPVELAKAFDSPLLRKASGHQKVDHLLRDIGQTKVRYGEILLSSDSTGYPSLAIGAAEYVKRPTPNSLYR